MKKVFATMLLAITVFSFGFASPEVSEAYTKQEITTAVEKASTGTKMLFIPEADLQTVQTVLEEKGMVIIQQVKVRDQNNNFYYRIRFH